MRILIAHNAYQQRGGEDTVVEAEAAALSRLGREVSVFLTSNDDIHGLPAKLRAATRSRFNPDVLGPFAERIDSFRPDVIHLHNTFPRLTPGAVTVAAERGVPVVQTAHNYRLMCANAQLYRDGRPCELCAHGAAWHGVVHRCFRGSSVGSLTVGGIASRFLEIHRRHRRHHSLIALTPFARGKLVGRGYDPDRIHIKGNSIADPGTGPATRNGRFVFVGRLSPEKGANTVLALARAVDAPFDIVGAGPESERLMAAAPANVRFLGALPHAAVVETIKAATALLAPSNWYEGFPMVLVESMAAGTPALVSRLGALEDIVEHERTGFCLPPGDIAAWADAVRALMASPPKAAEMGRAARGLYDDRYSEALNAEALVGIYRQAIDRSRAP